MSMLKPVQEVHSKNIFKQQKNTLYSSIFPSNMFTSNFKENSKKGVSLDISQAFDKLCDLIFKLKQCSISAGLTKMVKGFLTDHTQRVILNSQISS